MDTDRPKKPGGWVISRAVTPMLFSINTESQMSHYDDSKYKILQLQGMPPGVFGETYVVTVGIHTLGHYYKGEYHIITQRPEPLLESGTWRFEQAFAPIELLTVDLDFMVEESITFAQNHIYDRLIERAAELKADCLLTEQVVLKECAVRPFVGCWIRNTFNQQIVNLAQTTECTFLYRYLHALSQIRPIQQG